MKKIRIVFVLFIICSSFVVNAQTNKTQQTSNKICAQKKAICSIKSITQQTSPKESLVVTKQRRLKSYQSNHKIARKRKIVVAESLLAANK